MLANRLVGVSRDDKSQNETQRPLRALRIAAIILPITFHSILCSAVGASSPKATQPHSAALEAHPNIVVERRIEIPLRDGVKLRATFYRPDAPGRFPAIVYRTPYGQEDYSDESGFPIKAAQRGYLVFLVDVHNGRPRRLRMIPVRLTYACVDLATGDERDAIRQRMCTLCRELHTPVTETTEGLEIKLE